jgi:hypothetical protein
MALIIFQIIILIIIVINLIRKFVFLRFFTKRSLKNLLFSPFLILVFFIILFKDLKVRLRIFYFLKMFLTIV